MRLSLQTEAFSLPGREGVNEDAVLKVTSDDGRAILAIADGMGGHSAGDVASSLAIDETAAWFRSESGSSMDDLFGRVYKRLADHATERPEIGDLGTTLTVCLLAGATASVGHVGDCRLYHLRGTGLITRTRDQTELQHLLDDRVITRDQARHYPRPNVLISVLSPNHRYKMHRAEFNVRVGDRLVLCSDGLYKVLRKSEIANISINHKTLRAFAAEIKHAVEAIGPRDDYSAVVCEVVETA